MNERRASASPYLHVVGPKALELNAKANLDITTRHPEGNLAACILTIKLLDGKNVIKADPVPSNGHVRVPIDASGAPTSASPVPLVWVCRCR